MTNTLNGVFKGMDVVDCNGHKIGVVADLKMTDEDPATAAAEQIEPDEPHLRDKSLIDNFIEVFRDDGVPEPAREELLRKGFIRIDADGLMAADRYATPEQIASVDSSQVKLSAAKDDLIKHH